MTRQSTVAVGAKIPASPWNALVAAVNKTKQLVTPTSVANASIGTYGAVTFSGASSVSLNGVFTSEFDAYEIEFDASTSGAASLQLLLRLAGTDATASNYYTQRFTAVNATPAAVQSLAASNYVLSSPALSAFHAGTAKLQAPALATATSGTVQATVTPNPMTTSAGIYLGGLLHSVSTAYDGFTVTPSTGTISGWIRVYGII